MDVTLVYPKSQDLVESQHWKSLKIIIQMLVVGGDGGKSCYPKDVQQLLHSTVNKHSQLVQSTLCRRLEKVVDLHCFFL